MKGVCNLVKGFDFFLKQYKCPKLFYWRMSLQKKRKVIIVFSSKHFWNAPANLKPGCLNCDNISVSCRDGCVKGIVFGKLSVSLPLNNRI